MIPGHIYKVTGGSKKPQHLQNSKQVHQSRNLVVGAGGTNTDKNTNDDILSDEMFAEHFFLNNKF